jgi:hypothetical protein
MTRYYEIPSDHPSALCAFLYAMVDELRADNHLVTDGVVLKDNDLELVFGLHGSSVFQDTTIVDDVALNMTPIVYEFVGYFPEHTRYDAAPIAPGTALWRLMHNHPGGRKPLLAVNAIHMHFDAYWREMDNSSTVCPTLDAMEVQSGQTIRWRGQVVELDTLDCRHVNMFEVTRLSSMTEMVLGPARGNSRAPHVLVDGFKQMADQYRRDRTAFLQAILRGRVLVALSLLAYNMIVDNSLMFGNAEKDVLNHFIGTMGLSSDHVQWLRRGRFHTGSPGYQLFQPHFERDEVSPFLIEFNDAVRDVAIGHLVSSYEALALSHV